VVFSSICQGQFGQDQLCFSGLRERAQRGTIQGARVGEQGYGRQVAYRLDPRPNAASQNMVRTKLRNGDRMLSSPYCANSGARFPGCSKPRSSSRFYLAKQERWRSSALCSNFALGSASSFSNSCTAAANLSRREVSRRNGTDAGDCEGGTNDSDEVLS
jgi:hypothetical protein